MPKLPLMKFLWPSSAVNKSDVSIYFPWQNTYPFISWIRKWQDDQNRKVQLTITISPLGHFAKGKKKRWISIISCKVWFLGWQAGNIQLSEEMFHLYLRQTYQQLPWQCNKTAKEVKKPQTLTLVLMGFFPDTDHYQYINPLNKHPSKFESHKKWSIQCLTSIEILNILKKFFQSETSYKPTEKLVSRI